MTEKRKKMQGKKELRIIRIKNNNKNKEKKGLPFTAALYSSHKKRHNAKDVS